jgi:hypothetical protein
VAVLVVHQLEASLAYAVLTNTPPFPGDPERRGLVAFAAEEQGELAAIALAESEPQALHVVAVEGRPDACLLLLERLVRLAGERDVTAWSRDDKPDYQEMLEGLGFSVMDSVKADGRHAFFHRLCRNA